MELARPQLDVGLFTNKLEEARAFYGEKLGLQFESILPVAAASTSIAISPTAALSK